MNILRLTLILVVVLMAPALASGQDDHRTDSLQRFELMRITPPVKIVYWDGKRIEAVYIGQKETKAFSFDADENSRLDIAKDFKAKGSTQTFLIIYCSKNHAKDEQVFYPYVVSRILPSQIIK